MGYLCKEEANNLTHLLHLNCQIFHLDVHEFVVFLFFSTYAAYFFIWKDVVVVGFAVMECRCSRLSKKIDATLN